MNDSYSNPFSGVNATQLDENKILEYWCNPFTYDLFSEIKEEDIYEDSNNIVFMGGRSTGKSMFLRYWSYQVQCKVATKEEALLIDVVKLNKGIGFYLRMSGSMLKSFQGHGLSEEHWTAVFTHYFELMIGRQYIHAIKLLHEKGCSVEDEIKRSNFIAKVCEHLGFNEKVNIDELIEEFDRQINHVELFRGDVAFFQDRFKPITRGYASQSISFGIAHVMFECLQSFADLNIIILLDEYENYSENQQRVINTLLRFSEPHIKFRIGMRLEGFRTYRMVTKDDFIKEGREYRKVVFEEVINKDKDYHEFLREVAKKRLEAIPVLREKGFIDIKSILTKEEDLEQEAKELARNKPDKVYELFSNRVRKEDLDKVRCSENPLLELLNFIRLMRGISPDRVSKSMQDYLNKRDTEEGRKYRRDYIDKYKLSLTILLCSFHKKPKLYYSFNTFAFLSSGIVGHFLELCRRSFAVAGWSDKDRLLSEGNISKDSQSEAAYNYSRDEKQQISRIEDYGGGLSRFINNIGIIFREYHTDVGLRYPETNQFAINIDAIEDVQLKNVMKAAIKWSVIQKKPKMQRTAPSETLQDTYTINRIFAPTFRLSYRTRGGKSVLLNEDDLVYLMGNDVVDVFRYAPLQYSPKNKPAVKKELNLFTEDE
jgi:hypothetical protein